ncbi:hypothetical protein [Treponema endosymbiont of Eucomonympha sp.]|nr:hypothetical protein [Treponema endosymbiont of Eucomonympha sp.]
MRCVFSAANLCAAVRLTDNAEAFHALASLRSVTVREAGTDGTEKLA